MQSTEWIRTLLVSRMLSEERRSARVVSPEVMAPLADTVALIHYHSSQLASAVQTGKRVSDATACHNLQPCGRLNAPYAVFVIPTCMLQHTAAYQQAAKLCATFSGVTNSTRVLGSSLRRSA